MANMMAARQAGAPAGLERRWRAAWAAVGGTWRVAFAAAACASVALAWAWRAASGAVGGEPAHVPATLAIGLVVTGVAAAAAALVDVHEHRLPNALVGLVALSSLLAATATGQPWTLGRAVLGGALAGGLMFTVHLSRGVGLGDVKLAAALGCSVGPLAVLAAPAAVGIAAATAAGVGYSLRKARLALGPALWLGWAVATAAAAKGWLA